MTPSWYSWGHFKLYLQMKKLISTLIGWHVDTAILWLSEHDIKFALIEKELDIQDCSFKNADILIITNTFETNSHVEGIIFNTWT